MEHPGEELVFVLEGAFEMDVDGKTYPLRPGDALHFRTDRPHRWRNPSQAQHPGRLARPPPRLKIECAVEHRETRSSTRGSGGTGGAAADRGVDAAWRAALAAQS